MCVQPIGQLLLPARTYASALSGNASFVHQLATKRLCHA